jgi:hypothetical protein
MNKSNQNIGRGVVKLSKATIAKVVSKVHPERQRLINTGGYYSS